MSEERARARPGNPGLIVEKRRVFKIGGSFAITLPQEFVRAHNIKEGDDIPVLANHILKIVPMPEQS